MGGGCFFLRFGSRSTIGGGGGGCRKLDPTLGGDGTKIGPPEYIFDRPPGEMSWIRGKLADHVGDHVVLPPEGAVLVISPGTESSYPRPPIVERLLGRNGTKIAPLLDMFAQPCCERSSIERKLADHVGGHVVLSPRGAVLVISPGKESLNTPTPNR